MCARGCEPVRLRGRFECELLLHVISAAAPPRESDGRRGGAF